MPILGYSQIKHVSEFFDYKPKSPSLNNKQKWVLLGWYGKAHRI